MSEKTRRRQAGALEVKAGTDTSGATRFPQVHPLIEEAFTAPVLYPCGAPTTHLGCHLCAPSCAERRPAWLICSDWGWIERRPPPWRLQLPHSHPGLHALVFFPLSRGYRDQDDYLFILTDVPLLLAERLPWAGQG